MVGCTSFRSCSVGLWPISFLQQLPCIDFFTEIDGTDAPAVHKENGQNWYWQQLSLPSIVLEGLCSDQTVFCCTMAQQHMLQCLVPDCICRLRLRSLFDLAMLLQLTRSIKCSATFCAAHAWAYKLHLDAARQLGS